MNTHMHANPQMPATHQTNGFRTGSTKSRILFNTTTVLLCSLAFTLLSGCASRSAKIVEAAPITQIMVLPVVPVKTLHTENKGVPLGVIWQGIANRNKSTAFNERMEATRNAMALTLTNDLLKELKTHGFDAQLLKGVERSATSPDDIDYPKLPTIQPVLHVYFEEVGMYSSRLSLDYIPRVNVTAELVLPRDEESIYSETIKYGADAGSNAMTSIAADPRYKWPSFDALMQHPKEVSDAYSVAVAAIALKIAVNLRTLSPAGKK